ncbi:kinesin-like nuclear fusion protein [Sporothrix epigloea]|uniref:Kinesin-like protein n=1 Tax=Sporothrix epigloea TaxID=1892477 RepID=A0ABP0E5L6_9PEZI
MNESLDDRRSLEEVVERTTSKVNDLQRQKGVLEEKNSASQLLLDTLRQQLQSATTALENKQQQYVSQLDEKDFAHRCILDDMQQKFETELICRQRDYDLALDDLRLQFKSEQDVELSRFSQEIEELRTRFAVERQGLQLEILAKDKDLQQLQSIIEVIQSDLDKERSITLTLEEKLTKSSITALELGENIHALQTQVEFFQLNSKQQSDRFSMTEARMQQALQTADEARRKLIKEEAERRILFNKYQELKGNIRVMCRVRPTLGNTEGEDATITFPDEETSSSQIDVRGPEEKSSLGVVSRKTIPFEFDRVFGPSVNNEEVFGEISQLVQSALDGYNVCVFCYGQTGSGKTYTMSSDDGMIPRATHMIYDNIKRLEEKSWSYTMEGNFVEVYNEELHDLLSGPKSGSSKDSEPKKKLEVRHDELRKTTMVVNCKTARLDSAEEVESMLRLAQSNRSMAATNANERSSRSHSIFILTLIGENAATGERCQATLNLVDLAGSERLKHSGAEGDRRKETQNINRSLACLGDVIEALGRGAPHIPYRNSKLTHLLQYSLGGNSKTLMFVMVHNTHIGTAKSSKNIKDRVSDA